MNNDEQTTQAQGKSGEETKRVRADSSMELLKWLGISLWFYTGQFLSILFLVSKHVFHVVSVVHLIDMIEEGEPTRSTHGTTISETKPRSSSEPIPRQNELTERRPSRTKQHVFPEIVLAVCPPPPEGKRTSNPFNTFHFDLPPIIDFTAEQGIFTSPLKNTFKKTNSMHSISSHERKLLSPSESSQALNKQRSNSKLITPGKAFGEVTELKTKLDSFKFPFKRHCQIRDEQDAIRRENDDKTSFASHESTLRPPVTFRY